MKVKTSTVSISKTNLNKIEALSSFIQDYKLAVDFYLDFLFNNKISYLIKDKFITFDVKSDQLDCPSFIPKSDDINFKSDLSARALKCASTQACSITKAALYKRKKYLYVFSKLQNEKKRTRSITKKLLKTPVIKPNLINVFPELNCICCNYHESNLKSFDNVIVLSSLGKKYGKIIIPIKHTKHSRKLEKQGHILKSFLISKNTISLRYEIDNIEKKEEGIVVGADQGITTCMTLSDGQITLPCKHGHTLTNIIKKIGRKEKGSLAFYKAKEHQKNYINWSINQFNFKHIKEIRLEKISNFRYKKNVGKFLNHFNEAQIRSKLIDLAKERGVLVVEQQSAYRSQRCSQCGYVYRGNRKGKSFSCKHCAFQADADYNASCNHEANLPSAQFLLYLAEKPRKFFWKEKGFYTLEGQEITVPVTIKRYKL